MSEQKSVIYRKDYQPPNYWVKSVDLAFLIAPEQTQVKSRMVLVKNPETPSHELFLDGIDLVLESIKIDGEHLPEAEYEVTTKGLILKNLANLTHDYFELSTTVTIEPHNNTALEGLYQSGDFFLTQCEAEGFRKITYYLDRPDVLAPFTVTIVANQAQYPVLLSNGNCLHQGPLSGGRHYAKWVDPHPKPSYLFALVAGDLVHIQDHYTTQDNERVQLRIYTEEQNIDACGFAMQSLKNSMRWDEQRFDLAYDLSEYNIVATDDFNMGAMENKGLNIFNSKYVLARQDTATDQDFIAVEAVIGHEYFHNWTGNRVTCRDWFQLSLKEGLTVFRDQEFTSDLQSRAVKRIEDVRYLRSAQFAEDASPMSHAVRPDSYLEINNFYTLTVYEKGAEVVRMYHTLLGEAGFMAGMKLYFERHDGQAVSCDDFRRAMADANQTDLTQFELWYAQNGTPTVVVEEAYDANEQKFTLTLTQQAPKNFQGSGDWQAMHIPVRLSLYQPDGKPYPLDDMQATSKVIELQDMTQRFEFHGIDQQPICSLFQNFSAPVKVSRNITGDLLSFLMKHDQDSFNRWDASQQMQTWVIKEKYQALLEDSDYACPSHLLDSFRHVLLDQHSDPALVAEAITLPTLKAMMQSMDAVDVLRLYEAKQWVVNQLVRHFQVEMLSVYHQNMVTDEYQVNPEQVGKRSLKNRCLWYLVHTNDREMHDLLRDQYHQSDNYNDQIYALTLMTHHQVSGFEDCLGEYYTSWQDNSLVINKWLSIQATIPASDTLERVKQLMDLPVFSLRNPNVVRSLIGAFCGGNITQFHAENGSGYEFLADQVLALDAVNPQVASRLVSLFNDFQKYQPETQHRMLQQIKRIHESKPLSSNVFEIVDRAIKTSQS